MFSLNGVGTPALFWIILKSHQSVLKTKDFMSGFGFLSTKMSEEFFYWECIISLRKLLLVIGTKLSDGSQIPSALINLFVTVVAFGAQVYTRPFANTDGE